MKINNILCDVLILAGGKNIRMHGSFKGSLQFQNMKFMEKVKESLLDETGTLIISYSSPEKVPVIMPGCKIVYDEIHNAGPIAGLISGLKACTADYLAVCACDMPFISKALYAYLMNAAEQHRKETGSIAKAIIPYSADGAHPLAAVYHKDMVHVLELAVKHGVYGIRKALPINEVLYVSVAGNPIFELAVTNINTVSEYVTCCNSQGSWQTCEF